MTHIRNPRDLAAGLFLSSVGLAFLWLGRDYEVGTWRQMGPGFFPIVLATVLSLLGVAISVKSFAASGEPVSGINVKGAVLITLAICLFGFLIGTGGLAVAVIAAVLIGAMASRQLRFAPMLLLAFGLSVFCVLAFIYGLGLPMPVFGSWFG